MQILGERAENNCAALYQKALDWRETDLWPFRFLLFDAEHQLFIDACRIIEQCNVDWRRRPLGHRAGKRCLHSETLLSTRPTLR